MKTVNKLFIVVGLAGILCGCKMDYFPTDELSSETLLKDPQGISYIMDGCYAVLKDQVEYLGYASGNDYTRHYFQMTEFPGDNTCLSSRTTDPLYQALTYTMTDDLKNVGTLWMLAYKVIGMSNTVIESVETNALTDAESLQLAGEAYFMRALMHLHMVTLFAKPYCEGTDNLGVPLRLKSDVNATVTRATVGEVYNQIAADLNKAGELLDVKSRGNHGYPNRAAAYGLLTRVKLYMKDYQGVIDAANLATNNADVASMLTVTGNDFGVYFANAKTSDETLFCIGHEITDDKGQGSLGSMYNAGGNTGWGEVYPSNPLLYMYERYPQDVRYSQMIVPNFPKKQQPGMWTYFPDPTTTDRDLVGAQTLEKKLDTTIVNTDTTIYFKDGSTQYTLYKKDGLLPGSEYKEWYVDYKGETCLARVHVDMKTRTTDYNPQWFVLKFANQDGRPQLSSPVFVRWGEVVLNVAEALVQMGNDAEAIRLVNAIRTRAGIPAEGLYEKGTSLHGYSPVNQEQLSAGFITDNPVLNVVLDERRLELAFEGHRVFDEIRNHLNMDRRYPGANQWEIVPYNREHMQYPIPFAEYSVSGIPQNPGY